MDIVYPYRSTADDFEIRYSLRSLANVTHSRVIVAGDKPAFASPKLLHCPVERHTNRFVSSSRNIAAAITEYGITGRFMVMNDDIFLLDRYRHEHRHRCTMIEYLRGGAASGGYKMAVIRTLALLAGKRIRDPLFFGLHTPTVYDADKLLEVMHKYRGQPVLMRTLYHNLFPEPSEQMDDVKLRKWEEEPTTDVVSITDGIATQPAFREWMQCKFPHPSQYEATQFEVRAA